MSSISHNGRRILLGSAAAGVLIVVPAAYMAGSMAEMSQVRPVLSQLDQARQALARQEANVPQEPPAHSPSGIQLSWGAQHVTITWTRVKGAASYAIFRAEGTQAYQQAVKIGQVSQSGTTVTFVDDGVTPGTLYTYWIAPVNTAGQGPVSAALAARTYLPWPSIVAQGEKAARTAQATAWSQGAWGLLPPKGTTAGTAAWRVGGQWYSAFSFPPSDRSSTWMTKKWTTWTLGGQQATVTPQPGNIYALSGDLPTVSSLLRGVMTAQDMAVWERSGHWYHEVVGMGDSSFPPYALILNRYAQAVALTTGQGTAAEFPAT